MTAEEHKGLHALLDDAAACPRLSSWEESFLVSMTGQANRKGSSLVVSDKQRAALHRIEKKVYAVG